MIEQLYLELLYNINQWSKDNLRLEQKVNLSVLINKRLMQINETKKLSNQFQVQEQIRLANHSVKPSA